MHWKGKCDQPWSQKRRKSHLWASFTLWIFIYSLTLFYLMIFASDLSKINNQVTKICHFTAVGTHFFIQTLIFSMTLSLLLSTFLTSCVYYLWKGLQGIFFSQKIPICILQKDSIIVYFEYGYHANSNV